MKNFFLRIGLFFLIVFSQTLFALDKPYSYSYIPKVVYQKQVFPVTVYAKHYNPNEDLSFEFDSLNLLQPINTKPIVIQNQNEAFFTFYFKINKNKEDIEIPTLTIWNSSFSYILHAQEIKVKRLDSSKKVNFSNVIASSLQIDNVTIDPYDSKYLLVTLFLSAKEANLEDFHIPNSIDEGIEKIQREGANTKIKYYFIVKNSVKSVTFSYFDTLKKEFIEKKIDLEDYKNRIVHKGFNPKELTFDKLKQYFMYALVLFFLIMFFVTKEKLYIILFTLLALFILYTLLFKKTICIKEGASLYILPTTHSTVFTRIDKEMHKNIIRKYKNFYKINLKDDITGWIKDEDVCKN